MKKKHLIFGVVIKCSLYVSRNFLTSSQVGEERQRVDVEGSGNGHGDERAEDEDKVEVVLGEGEHGDADVAEDEVLREKVEHFKQLLRPLLGLQGQVVERVVSLKRKKEITLFII